MSKNDVLEDKFKKVQNKFTADANWYLLIDYLEEVNSEIAGGGGDVTAEDVSTSDGSNVQVKLDDLEGTTGQNTSDISDNATAIATNTTAIATNTTAISDNTTAISDNTTAISDNATAIANLSTADTALLRLDSTLKEYIDYIERYSLLTVFISATGTGGGLSIADGSKVNILDFSWANVTESPSIEGLGRTFDGNVAVDWVGIYTETGVGTGDYTGTIIKDDTTNSRILLPDPEVQTNGLWKSYGLDVSVRVEGRFTGGVFSTDNLEVEFTDGDVFATNSTLLSPLLGTFSAQQTVLVSRLDKSTSSLIQDGLIINITPNGSEFILEKVDLIIKIGH